MNKEFHVGDHVGWNSEAGHVRGTIKKQITSTSRFKNYTVHALERGAAILDEKRHNRPSGHAQGIGTQETQEEIMATITTI
jgi:hypothetical protein